MNIVPSDFDWVTARAECSAVKMFETLRLLAKANVDQRNKIREQDERVLMSFHDQGYMFVVSNAAARSDQRQAVDFKLESDEKTISVAPTVGESFQVTLTLDNQGQCKFKVGDNEFDPWQVLKKALEPIFF